MNVENGITLLRPPPKDILVELVTTVLKSQVDPEKKLISQGLDSLGAAELLDALHQRGFDVDYEFLLTEASIDSLITSLREKSDEGPKTSHGTLHHSPFALAGPQTIWATLEDQGWGAWANISLCISMPASLIRATYLPAIAQSLADNNESMRMVLGHGSDGETHQSLIPDFQVPIEMRDAPALERDAMRLVEAFEAKECSPFEPSTRALVLSCPNSKGRHWLCITMHHVFSDRVSMHNLAREFSAMVAEKDWANAPTQRVQYADYAEWQSQRQKSTTGTNDAELRSLLSGADTATNRPAPTVDETFALDSEGLPTEARLHLSETQAIEKLAGRLETTLPLFVHAVSSVLVARLTGDERVMRGETDMLFCHVVSNRERHAALRDLVGCLDTSVPVAVRLVRGETLKSLCQKTQQSFTAAHQCVSDMPRGSWLDTDGTGSDEQRSTALFERVPHINIVRAPAGNSIPEALDVREHSVRRVQKTRWGLLLRVHLPSSSKAESGAPIAKDNDLTGIKFSAFSEDPSVARLVPNCLVELLRNILSDPAMAEGDLDVIELVERVLERARFAASQVRRASALLPRNQTNDAFIYDKLVARQKRWYVHDANHTLCRDASNRFVGTPANPFPFTQLDKLKERAFLEDRGAPVPKLLHVLPKEDLQSTLVDLAPTLPDSFVIKPVGAGHSFGVTLVRNGIDLSRNGAPFDAAIVAGELTEMAGRGFCSHEGRDFLFNFSSFLVEDLVVDERGFPAPTDYKVFMIGETFLWLQLHFRENGYNWVAFVSADFELMPQPAWDPVTCWRTHRALVCTEQSMVDARRPKCLSGILEHSNRLAADMGIFVRLDWYADETHGPLMGEITTFPHMLQPRSFYTPWANDLVKSVWQDPDGVACQVSCEPFKTEEDPITRIEALLENGNSRTCIADFLPQSLQGEWAFEGGVSYDVLRKYMAGFDLAPWDVARGSRIALMIANGVQLGALLLATMNRYVAVPMGKDVPVSLAAAQIEQSGIRTLVVIGKTDEARKAHQIARIAQSLTVVELTPHNILSLPELPSIPAGREMSEPTATNSLNDDVLVLRTSGSTGDPKSVTYTLEGLIRSGAMIARSLELRQSDVGISMLPLHHVGGIACNLVAPLLSSTPMRFHQVFDPKAFFDALTGPRGATWAYLVPALWDRVIDYANAHPELQMRKPWPRLRAIRSAGSNLSHDAANVLSDLFGDAVAILPTYGMTEAMPIAAPLLSYRLERPGSVGRVLPNVSVEIIDHTDPDTLPAVAHGAVGEVTVKGPTVFKGYEDGAPGSYVFTPRGFFRTGDLGYLAADGSGSLHIIGRIKDTINAGGETIAPGEVEAALRGYPGWAANTSDVQVMAFARSHKSLGEDVAIAIGDTSIDSELARICAWASTHLPQAMCPKTLVHLSELPRTNSGKLTRAKFAERFNKLVPPGDLDLMQTYRWKSNEVAPKLLKQENTPHHMTAETGTREAEPLEQILIVARHYVSSSIDIGPDTHLSDAGVNSLAAVELSIQLNKQFEVDLPTWVLSDHPTPRALHAAVLEAKYGRSRTDASHREDALDSPVQTSSPEMAKTRPMRMLFLHGEGADAELMEKSLRATHWTGRLAADIEFVFLDAPHTCAPMPEFHSAAIEAGFYSKPQYRTWRITNSRQLEHSITAVRKALESLGPFDAIGGICDGALLAAIVGSEYESLKFFLSMSPSPISRLAQPQANADWRISCRSLHLVSPEDEQHSLLQQFEIVERCERAFLFQHNRGHAVPVLESSLEHEMRQALVGVGIERSDFATECEPTVLRPAFLPSDSTQEAAKFEQTVTDVMARILGRETVERTEDFFELGGDSLKALALVQKLEKKLGIELPFERVFLDGASVVSLARLVADHAHRSDAGSVVALNKSVSQAEIFALPTLIGHLTDYIALGAALECSARLIGVKPRLLESRSCQQTGSLSELAREAATIISNQTDRQVIDLVGCSAAGIIAFETAKVLQEWGYDIGCLALIDSDATTQGSKWPVPVRYISEWQKDISRRLRGKSNQRKRYVQLSLRAQLTQWKPSPIKISRPIFFKAELGSIDDRQIEKWRAVIGGNLDVVSIGGDHTGLRGAEIAAQIAKFISARISAEQNRIGQFPNG